MGEGLRTAPGNEWSVGALAIVVAGFGGGDAVVSPDCTGVIGSTAGDDFQYRKTAIAQGCLLNTENCQAAVAIDNRKVNP
jgi:hypothetical protein